MCIRGVVYEVTNTPLLNICVDSKGRKIKKIVGGEVQYWHKNSASGVVTITLGDDYDANRCSR